MATPSQVLLASLQGQLAHAGNRIDDALDRRDPRAFRMWAMKRQSLTSRLTEVLLTLAGKETP